MEEAKWYVLHTYSGYEDLVKANLTQMVENNHLEDEIFDIKILTEETVEERNGKKKVVVTKTMPCYVYIKLRYSSQIWYLVTNTRGVTGFVGPQGRPLPLTDDEVKRLHLEKPTVVVTDFHVGETVRIIDSSLEGFVGTIDAVDPVNSKCKVTVSMFGRLTPVELELYQIERLDDASSAE